MNIKKHKAKKIEKGLYEYRGYEIEKSDYIPSGYYGAWVGGFGKFQAESLKEAKQLIDIFFNQPQ